MLCASRSRRCHALEFAGAAREFPRLGQQPIGLGISSADLNPGKGDEGRQGGDPRRLWPDEGADDPGLRHLLALVERYVISGEADPAGDWRESLERRAAGILRRYREQPVTVFCHLLLCAVELHRLRQGLLQRALFNDLVREAAA
jgi:hypothetical protein